MSKDQKWAVEMTEYQTVFEPFVYVYFYAETETVPLHSAQNRNRYPNRFEPKPGLTTGGSKPSILTA